MTTAQFKFTYIDKYRRWNDVCVDLIAQIGGFTFGDQHKSKN